MTQALWNAIDEYIAAHVLRPDATLDAVLQHAAEADLPPISVAPNQGMFLHLLARLQKARCVLELGTLAGYSTIWLARGLPGDGRLITVESDAKHAAVARRNIALADLTGIVEVREEDALAALERLTREGPKPFDLVFIDADKKRIPQYFEAVLGLSRPGTLIIVDNVVREGTVLDSNSEDASVGGVRRFHQMLALDRRVDATTLQTVGSKGHDGFTLALVN
jgi:predicted O-methyltransferase YrrM